MKNIKKLNRMYIGRIIEVLMELDLEHNTDEQLREAIKMLSFELLNSIK